ncbi:thioredoxin family protein [Amaricoccus sp.]|uniref:DUF1223 domain-containing protein n=1 Tax=Amaricoccus sp. TaxID=1872485 RepID=UPI00262DC936|nr:DUF1223 domain-containing protein [Amaricoccus sp.]HRO10416.1 DUF1223 domain-containing protein [Amaricoccus sp.]
MRFLVPFLAAVAALLPAGVSAQGTPVVIELFTSQGCSSCPPADALLSELAGREGVIALALHVDYWDYLGWKDRFGQPAHTARQKAYAKAAHRRSIFTPEMIVQGEARVKGHDAERIAREIARYGAQPAPAVLTLARDGATLSIHLEPAAKATGPADIHIVRFLPSQEVAIEGGENAGSQLTYTNIVTNWETVARWDGASPVDMRYEGLEEGPVAVIVQRTRMGPVLAAATAE